MLINLKQVTKQCRQCDHIKTPWKCRLYIYLKINAYEGNKLRVEMKGTFSLFTLYASFYLNFILDLCNFKYSKVLNMYLGSKIAILIDCK